MTKKGYPKFWMDVFFRKRVVHKFCAQNGQ